MSKNFNLSFKCRHTGSSCAGNDAEKTNTEKYALDQNTQYRRHRRGVDAGQNKSESYGFSVAAFCSVCIALVLIFAIVFPSFALGSIQSENTSADETGTEESSDINDFGTGDPEGISINLDYSCGEEYIAVAPSELIYMLCGYECGTNERDYIDGLEEYMLKYSVTPDQKAVSVSGNGSTFKVTAFVILQSCANGVTLVWEPVTVSFDGLSVFFNSSDDVYTATISGLPEQQSYSFSVKYEAEFFFEQDIADAIVNRAFDDASAFAEKRKSGTETGDVTGDITGDITLSPAESTTESPAADSTAAVESVTGSETSVPDVTVAPDETTSSGPDETGKAPEETTSAPDESNAETGTAAESGIDSETTGAAPEETTSADSSEAGRYTDLPGDPDEEMLAALADEIDNGLLVRRTVEDESIALIRDFEIQVELAAEDIGDYPIVVFKDYDGSVLEHIRIKTGSLSEELIPAPNLPQADDTVTYVFSGWITGDGTPFSFESITADLVLYPNVSEKPVSYKVKFITASGTYETEYGYGDMPGFAGDTAKAADEKYYYVFSGWDKQFAPVTEDTSYTAVYTAEDRYYTVKWTVGSNVYRENYKYGETPEFPATAGKLTKAHSETEYFTFAGWDSEPKPVTGDCTYTALFTGEWIAPGTVNGSKAGLQVAEEVGKVTVTVPAGTSSIDLSYVISAFSGKKIQIKADFDIILDEKYLQSLNTASGVVLKISDGGYTGQASVNCRIGLENSNGGKISADGITVSIPSSAGKNICIYLQDGNGWTEKKADEKDGAYSFVLNGTGAFAAVARYKITAEGSDKGEIILSSGLAGEGETVSFILRPGTGYTAEGTVVYTVIGGVRTAIAGYEFTMPAGEVTLEAEWMPEVYTVSFYSDGQLFFSEKLKYGEPIVLPDKNPRKSGDDGSSYTFSGWSPEVTGTVTGDCSFNAIYEKTEEPKQKANLSALYIAIAAVILISVSAFIIVKLMPVIKRK